MVVLKNRAGLKLMQSCRHLPEVIEGASEVGSIPTPFALKCASLFDPWHNGIMDLPGSGQLCLGLPRSKPFHSIKISESQIERSICDFLRIKRIFFWKQPNRGYFMGKVLPGSSMMVGKFRKDSNPYTKQGIPDIIVVHQGQFIGLEVKTPQNDQTTSQIEFQKDVEQAGGKYFVVRSIEDVETILKGL